jgi:trehalose-6-phosphatase
LETTIRRFIEQAGQKVKKVILLQGVFAFHLFQLCNIVTLLTSFVNMIPSALEHIPEIARRERRPAVFLDYDGTLTPIVSQPQDAWLSDSMRQTLRSLAARVPVAILSGRDLDDVRGRVHVDGIVYAGSHGFDIAGTGGLRRELGTAYLSILAAAEAELREALEEIPGAQLERKHFSVAAHYRNVNDNDASRVALWLLETLGLECENVHPIYIGDDNTDEDAFRALEERALEERGIGILVSEQSQPTAARYSLRDPAEVESFLRALTADLRAVEL